MPDPASLDTLYHYCSNETFLSIIHNKRIRLSSLTQSNDFLEGKLLKDLLLKLAKEDDWPHDELEDMKLSVEGIEKGFHMHGFCLSNNGDLLSQWRGYANDAEGLSIGFSKNGLQALKVEGSATLIELHKIAYEEPDQLDLLRRDFEEIRACKPAKPQVAFFGEDIDDPDEVKAYDVYLSYMDQVFALFLIKRFQLKSKAFKEEQEWRLLELITLDSKHLKFKANQSHIIPFTETNKLEPGDIKKVILGPKNKTPIHVVEDLLRIEGFKDVQIHRSEASYI